MSAATRAGSSGVVLGVAVAFLWQQFGYLDFTLLLPAIEQLLIAAILGGVVFGLVGWAVGRRVQRKAKKPASDF